MSEITGKLSKVLEAVRDVKGIHSLRNGADIKPSVDLIDRIAGELKEMKDHLVEHSCDDVITIITTVTAGSFKTVEHLNRIRYEKSSRWPRLMFEKGGKDGSYVYLTKGEVEKILPTLGEKVVVVRHEYSDDSGDVETSEVVDKTSVTSDLWNFVEKKRRLYDETPALKD